MSEAVQIDNNSINMDDLSELTPTKTIETMKSKNIIMNAILLGIQRAINRRGKEYNIPSSIRENILNEVQSGGGPIFSALKTAKNIYNYKKTASKQLEKMGVDKKTAKALRSASSLKDVRNIGIKSLKRFGNVPPPKPESFGKRTLKNIKLKLGLIKEEPETLTKEDLKRIGIEGLKRMGIVKRLGISEDQLRNMDSISPDTIKKMGKQLAIQKLRNTGVLNKLGMSEEELNTMNISQIKQIGKQLAVDKLKKSGFLKKLGMTEEQIQNATSNDIKRAGIERLKQLGMRTGITSEGINNVLSPDNPDFQKDTGPLVAIKIFSNVKNMYVGLIKKIIIVSDFFASKIIDYATQGALNTPITELTANTNKRVLILAAYLREVANNPEQLKAIGEISEALGVMGIEFIDTIKPSIDKIIDKLIDASQQVGSKSAFGAIQTFFSIASSIVAAVPGIGGIVDLLVSIAMAFNSVMRVVRTFVESNSDAVVDASEAAGKTVGTVRKNTGKIMGMVDRLKQSIPTGVPTQEDLKESIPTGVPIQEDEYLNEYMPTGVPIQEDEYLNEYMPTALPIQEDEYLNEYMPTALPIQEDDLPIANKIKTSYEQQNGGANLNRHYISRRNSTKMSKSRKRIENSVFRFKNLNEKGKYSCHNHSSRTRKCIHY